MTSTPNSSQRAAVDNSTPTLSRLPALASRTTHKDTLEDSLDRADSLYEFHDAQSSTSDSTHSHDIDQRVGADANHRTIYRPGLILTRSISEIHDGIVTQRDPEHGLDGPTDDHGDTTEKDPHLVAWDGVDDPGNPKNWAMKKKWGAVVSVSLFTFISPVSSTMIAPALPLISRELGISTTTEAVLALSIFVLAYAIGPLILGPLSEIFGRTYILQISNLLYLAFNTACGFAKTKEQLIAFRFMSGLGGSAPLAIGGGVLSDLFHPEQRGKAISVYSLAPLLGPAVGPVAGAFISENISWRWIFWILSAADAAIQIMGLVFLKETYAPVLLQRRKKKLIKQTGNTRLHTATDDPDRKLHKTLRVAFVRPFRLLGTQPIVQVLGIYMMYLYGLMYLVLSTFPDLWASYGFSTGIAGLHYLAMGIGFFLGAQIGGRYQDKVYKKLKRRDGVARGKPEYRVPMMAPGAFLVPVGLLIYGWTAQYRVFWVGPDIGVMIFTAGVIIGFQCIQGYLVDSYTRYAASAIGAATVLRSLAGFGFPLFARQLYAKLDYGYGNTLLAGLGILIGWPAPFLLWKYGERLRQKSKFAAGGAP